MRPVYQIVNAIRAEIEAGLLKPGARLLSIRSGAQRHGVSKNTMADAYDRLVAQGLLVAQAGSGYFVAQTDTLNTANRQPHVAQAMDTVSLLREQLVRQYEVRVGDGRLPASWARGLDKLTRGHLPVSDLMDHGYGNPWGYEPLRERIALMLRERGIKSGSNQILLTYGANHALDLVARYCLVPGDVVLVDSPGYYPLFGKLQYSNVQIIGVRRTVDGPDLNELEHACKTYKPKLFFTQTLAHNPTGTSATLPVCHRILTLAEQHQLYVVEDDPFADILPVDSPRLATLDQLQRVIYVGTFSKTLSAGVRVGYMTGPETLLSALCDLKMLTLVATSDWAERTVYDLIVRGQYLKHLRRLKTQVERAQKQAYQALSELGLSIFAPPTGGFYLWVLLPSNLDETAFLHAASQRSIFIAPGSLFMPDRSPARAMRINIAYALDKRFLDLLREWVH
ncbi:aminotransferase-like domain-containing protein [Alcaligenes sp. SDU_A2]|uniref:aminotransferase-like domain-containing protein n=1 Tax=Alcaligenes sp. SDU_A2 TaxID=3136634 RepID=UPI00311D84FD